jgi:hypothetical protein
MSGVTARAWNAKGAKGSGVEQQIPFEDDRKKGKCSSSRMIERR